MINKASRVLSEAVDTALDTLLRSTSIHSFEWEKSRTVDSIPPFPIIYVIREMHKDLKGLKSETN